MKTSRHPTMLPFTRSYWVRPGQLLAGFYPGDRDSAIMRGKLSALLDCGVNHIINLMQVSEGDHAGRPFLPYEHDFLRLADQRCLRASCSRRPIRDLDIPTLDGMKATLDAVDETIHAGGCAYVHCWGGRGRTGTVIGCWLARHGETDPLTYLRQLTTHASEHFRHIPETPAQQNFVRQWRIGQ